MAKCAFLGLGVMGFPMAGHLKAAGHEVSVYNRTTSTMEEQITGNPFMHFDTVDRFVHYRMHYHDRHRDSPYGPVCKGREME